MVLGSKLLERGLTLGGVVLNHIAGARHERIIRQSRGPGGIPRMRVAKEDGGGEGGYRARPTPPRTGQGARSKGARKRT